jgi:hypothetical protein
MEAPVHIERQFEGTGINSGEVWRMFRDTLGVAKRMHIQHRYDGDVAAVEPPEHVIAMRHGVRMGGAAVTR